MGRDGTPQVGDLAPDFTLPAPTGPVRLSALYAVKTAILYFYPKDFTSGCTVESCAFRDRHREFVEAGAEVVGISRDDVASHARFSAEHRLPFRLLSDLDGSVHDLYGVRSRFGGLVRDRVTFVIDRSGVVRLAFSSLLGFRGHVDAALKVVRSLSSS